MYLYEHTCTYICIYRYTYIYTYTVSVYIYIPSLCFLLLVSITRYIQPDAECWTLKSRVLFRVKIRRTARRPSTAWTSSSPNSHEAYLKPSQGLCVGFKALGLGFKAQGKHQYALNQQRQERLNQRMLWRGPLRTGSRPPSRHMALQASGPLGTKAGL